MRAIQIITDLSEVLNDILEKEIPGGDNIPLGFTMINILERVNYNIGSIKLLLNSNNWHHFHAINLICRNLLTDFISIAYFTVTAQSDDEVAQEILFIYMEEISKTDNFLKLYNEFGKVDTSLLNIIDKRKQNQKDILFLINELAKNYSIKKPKSPSTMIRDIKTKKIDNALAKEILNSYDIWYKLSKNEHFGWFSIEFTRNLDFNFMDKMVTKVLLNSIILSSLCLEYLKEKQDAKDILKIHEKFNLA